MDPAALLVEPFVLVVDDQEKVRLLVARILAEAGFHVLDVRSGEDAVAVLTKFNGSVQLVVSDIVMPGATGVDVATLMAEVWPSVPVLLISGVVEPDASPLPFLPKPFTADTLLGAVAALVPLPNHRPLTRLTPRAFVLDVTSSR